MPFDATPAPRRTKVNRRTIASDRELWRYVHTMARSFARLWGLESWIDDLAQDAIAAILAARRGREGWTIGHDIREARSALYHAMDAIVRWSRRAQRAAMGETPCADEGMESTDRRLDLLAGLATLSDAKGGHLLLLHLRGVELAELAEARGVGHHAAARQVKDAARQVAAHLGVTLCEGQGKSVDVDGVPFGSFLAELCSRGHDHAGTGRTLYGRQATTNGRGGQGRARYCIACSRERSAANYAKRKAAQAHAAMVTEC